MRLLALSVPLVVLACVAPRASEAPPPAPVIRPAPAPAVVTAPPRILAAVRPNHGCTLTGPSFDGSAKLRPARDAAPFIETSGPFEVTFGDDDTIVTTAVLFGGALAFRGFETRADRPVFAQEPVRFGGILETRGPLRWRHVAPDGTVTVETELPPGAAFDGQPTVETSASCNQLGLRPVFEGTAGLGGAPTSKPPTGYSDGDISATRGGPARLTGFAGPATLVAWSGDWARVVVQQDDFVAYGWIPKLRYAGDYGMVRHVSYRVGQPKLVLGGTSDDIACPTSRTLYLRYGNGFATVGTFAAHARFRPGATHAEFTEIVLTPNVFDNPILVKTDELADCDRAQIGPASSWRL